MSIYSGGRSNLGGPFQFAASGGGVAPTPLPQTGNMVARWSADDIPAQADNTALTTWTDSIGGFTATQGTTARRPKYRTGGQNGKPYLKCEGGQLLTVAGTTNAAYLALASANHTLFIVYRNPAPTTWGVLFAASSNTYLMCDDGKASGRKAGYFLSGAGIGRTPFTGTGLITMCATGGRSSDTGNGRIYLNNSSYFTTAPRANQAIDIGSWSTSPDTFSCQAEIYEVLIWSRNLTPAEVMQTEKWAREKYGSPYPWAGSKFRVFHGNSQTQGAYETSPDKQYPAQVAATNGWPFGTWTNLGHTGWAWSNLNSEAVNEVDPLLAQLGNTPAHLAVWEYFNTGNSQVAASAVYTPAITYLQARIAAGWTGANKIIFGTSIDAKDSAAGYSESVRTAYNAYWDVSGNRAGLMDAYVAIHLNTAVGIASACPNSTPFTPNFHTDGIHLIDAGDAALASEFAPVMASL